MRFEKSVEIQAPQQRVWEVLSDIDSWPELVGTVEAAEVISPTPLGLGSRVRLRQPKLPEGEWEITAWEPPVFFEWTQKTAGGRIVAGHRVDADGEEGSRLTLTIDMRGPIVKVAGRLTSKTTRSYLEIEATDLKRAAEVEPTGQ